MARGHDLEMRWIDLWNDLFEIVDREPSIVFVDEEWRKISLEDAKGLLQDGVYAGHSPRFEHTWYQGERALRILLGPAEPHA